MYIIFFLDTFPNPIAECVQFSVTPRLGPKINRNIGTNEGNLGLVCGIGAQVISSNRHTS